MTLKKKDRRPINFRIMRKAFDMLYEMAERDNRTMTSLLEVLIMDAYRKSGGNAGAQPPAGRDGHNA